jgi:hypothetical protein
MVKFYPATKRGQEQKVMFSAISSGFGLGQHHAKLAISLAKGQGMVCLSLDPHVDFQQSMD